VITEPSSTKPSCTGCGSDDAPHRGELVTTRVADGIVRDEHVRRCTECQKKRRRAAHAGEVS
jgi:hypothetical protein